MMKKNLLLIILGLSIVAVPSAWAGLADYDLSYLPESTYIDGVSVFNTPTVAGYVEYAVYDTSSQPLDDYDPANGRFIYAYQVFSNAGADIDAIAILGFDPLAVSSESLEVSDELYADSTTGMDATALLNTEDAEAYFVFDGGAVVAGENSWFLLMFSDYDWVKGTYEINPSDSDITVPGRDTDGTDTDNAVPEPATLALLLGGGLLSLARKK